MRSLVSAIGLAVIAGSASAATVLETETVGWGPIFEGVLVGSNAPGPRDRSAFDRRSFTTIRQVDPFDPSLGTLTRVDFQYIVLRDDSYVQPVPSRGPCDATPGGCDQNLQVEATFRYGVDLPPLDSSERDESPAYDVGFRIDRSGSAEGPDRGARIEAAVPPVPVVDVGTMPSGPPIAMSSQSFALDRFLGPDPIEVAFAYGVDIRQQLDCDVRIPGTLLQDCEAGTDFFLSGSARLNVTYVYDVAPLEPTTPIPLPPGLPLLAVSLAALGVKARPRKRAPGR